MTGNGTGPSMARSICRNRSVKCPGATLPSRRVMPDETDCPLTGTSFSPMTMNIVPRVARRSGIFRMTMRKALNSPTSAPASSTTTIATPPSWL